MTTHSLTNPNPKREGAAETELRHALFRLKTECEVEGLDLKPGFDAWVSWANKLLGDFRPPASARPSPGDPVRAALEALEEIDVNDEADRYEFRSDADYAPNDFEKTLLEDFGTGLLGKIEEALRAALSVSTPTGEGEVRSGCSKWGPSFPPSSCNAFEDCAHDGVCHDFDQCQIKGPAEPDDEDDANDAAALAHPKQGGELIRAGWKLFHVALRLPTDDGYRLAVHVVRATDQYRAIGLACICEGGLDQPMLKGTSVAELDTVSGGVLRVVRCWRYDPDRAATDGLIEDPSAIESGSVQIIEPTAPTSPSKSSGEEA